MELRWSDTIPIIIAVLAISILLGINSNEHLAKDFGLIIGWTSTIFAIAMATYSAYVRNLDRKEYEKNLEAQERAVQAVGDRIEGSVFDAAMQLEESNRSMEVEEGNRFEALFQQYKKIVERQEKEGILYVLSPLISLGAANTNTHSAVNHQFSQYKEKLLKEIALGLGVHVCMLNFLPTDRGRVKSHAQKFIESISYLGKSGVHNTSTTKNCFELLDFLAEICRTVIIHRTVETCRLDFVDSIKANLAMRSKDGSFEGMLFFLTLGELDAARESNISGNEQHRNISTFYSGKDLRFHGILSKLFTSHINGDDVYCLFERYEPTHLYRVFIKCRNFVAEGNKKPSNAISKMNNELAKLNEVSYEWIWPKETDKDWVVYKKNCRKRNAKNLLIVPSAAGIFSLHSDQSGSIVDKDRFYLYYNMIEELSNDVNVFLVSLTGQLATVSRKIDKSFSYDQSVDDVVDVLNQFRDEGVKIETILGLCTGAAESAEAVKRMVDRKLIAPPKLCCWDVPDEVGWRKNIRWFERMFPEVQVDHDKFVLGREPIEVLPEYPGLVELHHSSNNTQYSKNSFENLSKMTNVPLKAFDSLGHIPVEEQSPDEYKRLISSIIG